MSRNKHQRAVRFAGSAIFTLGTVGAAVVALVLLVSAGQRLRDDVVPYAGPAPATSPLRADVTVATGATTPVPRSFLGLSTEYWSLKVWTHQTGVLNRTLSLLRVPGGGPLVLRIGGDSADEALWEPRMRRVPEWVIELTSSWLDEASAVVRGAGVRLILDLNLLTATPAIGADWAAAAREALPPRSIVGFEIGNEPDLYNRQYWLAITSGAPWGAGVLPRRLSATDYAHDFLAYAGALSQTAPGIPLIGPAIATPSLSARWFSVLLGAPHPGLRVISAHKYPYSACAVPGTAGYPTVERLLSERATAGIAGAVVTGVRIAHRAGLPFRMTELNSVTCGGRAGVSDTFATALWAPDALFTLMKAGVDGINLHVRPTMPNAAFTLNAGGLLARPLLYGLLTFAKTLGPGARLVPARVSAQAGARLKAWAVTANGQVLHVLLINKGQRPLRTMLHLPATGTAIVQRLIAPSARSRSGVTLGGQHLSVRGSWLGRPRIEFVRRGPHGYAVTLPRMSAALIYVRTGHSGSGRGGSGRGGSGRGGSGRGGSGRGASGRGAAPHSRAPRATPHSARPRANFP